MRSQQSSNQAGVLCAAVCIHQPAWAAQHLLAHTCVGARPSRCHREESHKDTRYHAQRVVTHDGVSKVRRTAAFARAHGLELFDLRAGVRTEHCWVVTCAVVMTVRPAGPQPCHSVRALADLPQRLGSEYASIEVRRFGCITSRTDDI